MKIEMGAAEQNNKGSEFELPGFRFHPTEQELVGFYLKKMVQGKLHNFNFIGMLDLYRYDPWDLPSLSRWGERELFFFVPRDKKCQNGGRPNRITACGYWKATGSDRFVRDEHGKSLGLKKTLVFYKGRAPRGQKTDWVMNEYRMPDAHEAPRREVVLCRIHRKATPLKWLEQRAMNQAAAAGGAQNSMDDDLDYKSQETSMVSSLETKPLNVKIERDEVKKFHQFEASSSMEENTTTHSDVTSSQGCYPVDSISELNQFMESTVYGGFIDPVFQAFGAEEGKKNIEGFSSLMAMFNNSGNANISYDFGGGGFDSVFPEVEVQAKFNVPKLSLDFNCLSRSNNTQEKNPLIDLWSPSSLLCTPHSQEQS